MRELLKPKSGILLLTEAGHEATRRHLVWWDSVHALKASVCASTVWRSLAMPALSLRALPERLVVTVPAYQLMSDNPSRDKSYSCTYNMDMDRLRKFLRPLIYLFLIISNPPISPEVRHPKLFAKTKFRPTSAPRPRTRPGDAHGLYIGSL